MLTIGEVSRMHQHPSSLSSFMRIVAVVTGHFTQNPCGGTMSVMGIFQQLT